MVKQIMDLVKNQENIKRKMFIDGGSNPEGRTENNLIIYK